MNNSCAATGNCCKYYRVLLPLQSKPTLTCYPCWMPVQITTFKKYTKNWEGKMCDCAQIGTTPSYTHNGVNYPEFSMTFCNNGCCGSGSGSTIGTTPTGGITSNGLFWILVICVPVGGIIVILTITYLVKIFVNKLS